MKNSNNHLPNLLDIPIEITQLGSNQLRIKELSYSSLGTFHKCQYKFLLDKTLHASQSERTTSTTFAYGHAVGEGVQQTLLGKTREEVIFAMFLIWDYDFLGEEKAPKKSFAYAVLAVDKFREFYEYSDLSEYEVAVINNSPAVELSFKIKLPNGYSYRGFIDVVLAHKQTKALLVLEVKTSGANWLHEAMYKNSAQALGYTLVLETLEGFVTTDNFEIRYLVYKTRTMEYELFNFFKTFDSRILWVRDILDDCSSITTKIESKHFPRRGEFCFDFFKPCQFLDVCGLSTESLRLKLDNKSSDTTDYTVSIDLMSILDTLEEEIECQD